eukprot:CAMPEP_0183404106 /NCGR_PEP_ID=MMETSP0370-20130417/14978_1 /TAXON_ID=268820 /ORGANISM="Peridinium aciculiferum, Strain PAER-2" /LENGTH=319 /DNA_ID=CAMNT_0025585927 /DNA_START=41 /DNA_END=1000 /DNA_ORIENTATION=+
MAMASALGGDSRRAGLAGDEGLLREQQPQLQARREQKWADVSDSEGDDDDIEDLATDSPTTSTLPTASGVASGVKAQAPWRGNLAREPAAVAGWVISAAALEFIPTLTYQCPLVAVCVWTLPIDGTVTAVHFQEPWGAVVAAQVAPSTTAAAPGAGSGALTASMKKRRSKKRGDPFQEEGVMPEASEEVWQHRAAMRHKERSVIREKLLQTILAGALATKAAEKGQQEYSHIAVQMPCREADDEQCKAHLAAKLLPTPDPEDRALSRRAWRRALDEWCKAMSVQWCPEECHGSIASTEEWQSLATLSTQCDDCGSECSE